MSYCGNGLIPTRVPDAVIKRRLLPGISVTYRQPVHRSEKPKEYQPGSMSVGVLNDEAQNSFGRGRLASEACAPSLVTSDDVFGPFDDSQED
jgi:hypothetical protein